MSVNFYLLQVWASIQNWLERRQEHGMAKAMASLDVNGLTMKQIDLAESHVLQCDLDVVKKENPSAAVFLQWVSEIVHAYIFVTYIEPCTM